MTACSPIVKVRLTPEEKNAVPDWQEQVAHFQRQSDRITNDKRERFRICLHEGGHTVQYRNQCRWDVDFIGPYVSYEDGELHFAAGAVRATRINGYEPFPWQDALVSTSGFRLVEHFTAAPDEQFTIQNDLKRLRSRLGENGDMNEAKFYAKMMLECQLNDEPTFISQLEQACRDYEMDVYGNDDATTWGWREYRPELPGQRHCVAVTTSGYFGTLVEHSDELRLLTEGGVFRPEDELRGVRLEVRIAEPQKAGTDRAVRHWNEAVRRTVEERTAYVAGAT